LRGCRATAVDLGADDSLAGHRGLFAGQWTLIEELGAVPKALVWDGEGTIGRRRGGCSELTEATQAFRGVLGISVQVLDPADPESKGIVERANGYFETLFLPGRALLDPEDFNAQLGAWLPRANARHVRRLGARPADRIEADRAAMLGLHRSLHRPDGISPRGSRVTTTCARPERCQRGADGYTEPA